MNTRLFILILLFNCLWGQAPFTTVKHPPIDEQSAIVKSNTYDDVYWVTNDSDKEPYLFPLTSKGEIIVPDWMKRHFSRDGEVYSGIHITGAVLYDWESMATLGDTLIVGDIGNNGNARRDLGIYFILEPNPYSTPRTRALAWYPVRYEDQKVFPEKEWEHDCEAIFTFQGKVYLLTKHRRDGNINKPAPSTKLYRMDTRYTDKTNVLTLINRKENLGGWVTGADMAPDESALVFIAQNPLTTTIWYFPRPKQGDDFLSQTPLKYNLIKADQAEAVCFKDMNTVIVTNEQRDWFEIPLKKFSK